MFFLCTPLFVCGRKNFFVYFTYPEITIKYEFISRIIGFFLYLPSIRRLVFEVQYINMVFLVILALFCSKRGVANVVLDPQTNRPISADSILNNVMTFAPFYEKLVTDYRADLYIKGTMDIKRKNFILRYVPSMFRLQKGVRQYMVETYSDLHFTAPNIYDQKVKASMGTVHNSRGVPGMLEYFNINLYSSTLLYDRLLSPLAKNGRKYYKYLIDSVMGGTDNRQYKIRFIPRSKSDQLVGGYMIVSSDVWSVREIRFSGRSELLLFSCLIKMGSVGKDDEFLPVSYNVEGQFNFLVTVLMEFMWHRSTIKILCLKKIRINGKRR